MEELKSSNDAWKVYSSFIKSVRIENGVTSIGVEARSDCTSLTAAKHLGTQEQWNNFEIYDGNEALLNALEIVG